MGTYWDDGVNHGHYNNANVYFIRSYFTSSGIYRHLINHELGHVVGLDDPPPCNEDNSVMHHADACAGFHNWSWPQYWDHRAVSGLVSQWP